MLQKLWKLSCIEGSEDAPSLDSGQVRSMMICWLGWPSELRGPMQNTFVGGAVLTGMNAVEHQPAVVSWESHSQANQVEERAVQQ